MADRPITIKLDSRKMRGSLARRVLYGSLILLAIPLLIHTFFLYRREYKENLHDAFESLQYLAESRALYLEEMIRSQGRLLQAMEKNIPREAVEREAFLKREAARSQLGGLLYVEWIDGEPICDASLSCDPSFRPLLKEARQRQQFSFINVRSCESCLYVGRSVGGAAGDFLLIRTSLKEVFSHFLHPQIRTSLIDESGLIFFSTEPELQGKKFARSVETLSWSPYADLDNAWLVHAESGPFLAIKWPLAGTNYSLLLDEPEKNVAELQLKDYLFRIGSFLLIVCVCGGSILFWLTRRMAKPLESLVHCMQRIREGGDHVRFTPDRMGFEINALGLQMNQMLDAIFMHRQEAERERILRERLGEELRIGRRIQEGMLPKQLPEVPSLEIAPGFLAAREVSGDFYDLFMRKDGTLLIAIADAADKGISACLYSLSFRSMLRMAATTEKDLFAILQSANQVLLPDTAASSSFITAWVGLYDPKTKLLSYCNQGHPPAYLRKKGGEVIELSSSGIALGIQEIHPRVEEIVLEKEEMLFLYTDGVIEAHAPDRQCFGKKRLKEVIQEEQTAREMVEQLMKRIHLFCKEAPQADDVTFLAIRTLSEEA